MSEYFPHDYHARNDPKIIKLLRKGGWLYYGIYQALIEMLHEEKGFLEEDYEQIAYDLRIEQEVVKSIVNDFKLFRVSDHYFSSKRVLENLMIRNEKSDKASKSATAKWEKKYEEILKETKFDFEKIWNIYPRPEGRIESLKIFIETVLTETDYINITKAIENYKKYVSSNGIEPKYIKSGPNFFKIWQDWVNWRASEDEIPSEWKSPARRK